MAHAYSGHREMHVGHRRAKTLMRTGGYVSGYARGGHSDEAEDRKMMKRMLKEHESTEHEGAKCGGRLDKRARGGKMQTVMHEFKAGKLHSGSKKGPEVTDRKQAIAIGLSEARKAGEKVTKRQAGGPVRKITPSKRKPHLNINVINLHRRPPAGPRPLPGPIAPAGALAKTNPGLPVTAPVGKLAMGAPQTPIAPMGRPRPFANGGKIGVMRKGKDYGQGSGEGRLEEFKHMKGR